MANQINNPARPAVIPYLIVKDVPRLIEFLERAFGAKEIERKMREDQSVMHAEVLINGSPVMMGEAVGFPPMPASIYVTVASPDETYRLGIEAGAEAVMPPADQPYGERMGGFRDPSGNIWWVSAPLQSATAGRKP